MEPKDEMCYDIRLPSSAWVLGLMLVLVLACWMTGAFVLGLLLIPTIGVGVMVAMWRKSLVIFVMVMVLNPLSAHFADGVVSYWRGAPSIWGMGLPRLESFNVNRETRCFWTTGGCVLMGNEWVSLVPHNAAVRLMQRFFGPPSRSYDGPYPTKEEAVKLVSEAATTPVNEFLKGRIHVGDGIFELPPALAGRLTGAYGTVMLENLLEGESGKIQAAMYQERCVVLRLCLERASVQGQRETDSDLMVFFDRKTQRPFAYFKLGGDHVARFPPVPYLAEQEAR